MRITLRQLAAFDAVAREGSVSAAADAVALSQAAVSMSLSELETHLGAPLFHRRGRRLVLNDFGRGMRAPVRDLLERAEAIESALSSRVLSGTLRIAASSTIGNYVLPGLIAEFVAVHAAVSVDLVVGNTDQVETAMMAMRADFGLIEGFSHHSNLQMQRWREDELCIICAPDHALANGADIPADALRNQRWVLREPGSGTREVFTMASRELLPDLDVALELGDSEAVKRAVQTGVGLGCLSRLAVANELRHGELVALDVPALDLQRTLFALVPAGFVPSPLLSAFLSHIGYASAVPSPE